MASVTVISHIGGGDFLVTIAQTNTTATEEVSLAGLPATGRIIRQVTCLISGTGTTVDPIIGTVTDPGLAANAVQVVLENDTAAASTDNQPVGGACYHTPDGTLFYRSVMDAAADNTVNVRLLIRSGWTG